jgi:hypothetical protein
MIKRNNYSEKQEVKERPAGNAREYTARYNEKDESKTGKIKQIPVLRIGNQILLNGKCPDISRKIDHIHKENGYKDYLYWLLFLFARFKVIVLSLSMLSILE